MSKFIREFFCWLCCCCPKRSNGVINNPVVNEEMEMLGLGKSDVLSQPAEQASASSSSAGDASNFETGWVRKKSSTNRGSRSNTQRRDFYRSVGGGRPGRRPTLPPNLARKQNGYTTDF